MRSSGLARSQAGFTLLELLVVIVIIGIIVTFGILSIGNRALDDRLQVEAQRLNQILRLAAEEAEVKGIELGFRFTGEGYEFLVLSPEGKWGPYEGDPILRSRPMGDPFIVELRVDGRVVPPAIATKEKDKPVLPQVMVLSSGEVTPFALAIHARSLPSFFVVQSDTLGRFSIDRQEVR